MRLQIIILLSGTLAALALLQGCGQPTRYIGGQSPQQFWEHQSTTKPGGP